MTEDLTGSPKLSDETGPEGPQAASELELLAPAGDEAALEAALEAGADSVYFGLTVLNARRRARNFNGPEAARAVQTAHAHGARAYLTLNVDVAERELPLAARGLELARRSLCDAVLVRDPALLALAEAYPDLEFHFSTQTCMSSSADVAAAAELGIARVVLARELTLAEIKAASSVAGLKTEAFVQGALCFSVSGRCLLSSWIGGRSGNRGACASPCRACWTTEDEAGGTPLSMLDLAGLDRIQELRQAGVAALKIEGRMKTASWVRRAVELYRRALQGEDSATLRLATEQLGAYTGRRMTHGYLDGQREDLTGEAGRQAVPPEDRLESQTEADDAQAAPEATCSRSSYDLEMLVEARGIRICCASAGLVETWTIPKTVVRRPHKAVSIEQLLAWLSAQQLHGSPLRGVRTNAPEFLLVPHAVNALVGKLSKFLQLSQKKRDELADVELPEAVRAILSKPIHCPSNRTPLGSEVDRVRLDAEGVEAFLREVRPKGVIVEGLTAANLKAVRGVCRKIPLIVALPPVFFEHEIEELRQLLRECARASLAVEVNNWGGWRLAKEAGVRIESGPGLPVLNSLAACVLAKRGVELVTLSPEADRRQLEHVAANCPLPCSLIVFGRPPLMISRAELAAEYLQRPLTDRRGNQIRARCEQGLWVFRPAEPFDLRHLCNERLRVRHLVADLVASPNPLREWAGAPSRQRAPFCFNYDRGLV